MLFSPNSRIKDKTLNNKDTYFLFIKIRALNILTLQNEKELNISKGYSFKMHSLAVKSSHDGDRALCL
jgi:hypothetical protein